MVMDRCGANLVNVMSTAMVDPAAAIDWLRRRSPTADVSTPQAAERTLVELVRASAVSPEEFVGPALHLLRQRPDFAAIWDLAARRDVDALAAAAASGAVARAFALPLARLLIEDFLLPSPALELVLTVSRRALLFKLTQSDEAGVDQTMQAFLCALAQQCFLNEYVYAEGPDETVWVELLRVPRQRP
jgi:hypothetical protein